MEKISRILPSTRRFENVDHSSAQPVRPGAPAFGRPEGRVTRSALSRLEDLNASLSTRETEPMGDPDVVLEIGDKKLSEDVSVRDGFKASDRTSEQLKLEESKGYPASPKNVEAQKVEEMTKKFFRLEDKAQPVEDVTPTKQKPLDLA